MAGMTSSTAMKAPCVVAALWTRTTRCASVPWSALRVLSELYDSATEVLRSTWREGR